MSCCHTFLSVCLLCFLFSLTLSACVNKGLVSNDDRINSVLCLGRFCFFLCTVCQKHSYILYTLKSETAVLWWRLCKLDCDLRSYVRRVSLSGCEWFLKGPYSWRKPDFGEKSYLWSAFFNLWNRRTKIFPCWVFMILFVLQSLDLFFFFNLCSTCASLRRSISNLFVCCLLSKLFPLISSWWRQCDLAPPHLLIL